MSPSQLIPPGDSVNHEQPSSPRNAPVHANASLAAPAPLPARSTSQSRSISPPVGACTGGACTYTGGACACICTDAGAGATGSSSTAPGNVWAVAKGLSKAGGSRGQRSGTRGQGGGASDLGMARHLLLAHQPLPPLGNGSTGAGRGPAHAPWPRADGPRQTSATHPAHEPTTNQTLAFSLRPRAPLAAKSINQAALRWAGGARKTQTMAQAMAQGFPSSLLESTAPPSTLDGLSSRRLEGRAR
mmetsp:Transcript_58596/g.116347  ORF Transcript_58596/g.116347 Transcript_58596/m.116347 type:complete len:244 (+) Transcript_58596:35-766(+)